MTAAAIAPSLWTRVAAGGQRLRDAGIGRHEAPAEPDLRRDFILEKLHDNSDAFASEADVAAMMHLFQDRF